MCRVTAIREVLDDRLKIFVGVDDAIVEGIAAGACGWIAGLVNAFPRESVELFNLAIAEQTSGSVSTVTSGFFPLLRLDTVPEVRAVDHETRCAKADRNRNGDGPCASYGSLWCGTGACTGLCWRLPWRIVRRFSPRHFQRCREFSSVIDGEGRLNEAEPVCNEVSSWQHFLLLLVSVAHLPRRRPSAHGME